jgi:hypothetical protein
MLYPHSLLWHYLWLGPGFLLLGLALLSWRRGLHRIVPAFFSYLIFEAIYALTLWALDVSPAVSNDTYWRSDITALSIESLVKLAVIREIFSHLVRQRPAIAKQGTLLITCAGICLVALAVVAAVHAPIAPYAILSYSWILEQTIYLIETGLLLFIFIFAAYFHLAWDRMLFGIALGLSISACVGLGVFAICANGIFFERRYLLDFLTGGVYHACVLLWFYFLLSPTWPNVLRENCSDTVTSVPDRSTVKRLLARTFRACYSAT